MAVKYEITEEQKRAIETARKKNKDKRTEAKLKALVMRAEGYKSKEISAVTGFHTAYVSTLVSNIYMAGWKQLLGTIIKATGAI